MRKKLLSSTLALSLFTSSLLHAQSFSVKQASNIYLVNCDRIIYNVPVKENLEAKPYMLDREKNENSRNSSFQSCGYGGYRIFSSINRDQLSPWILDLANKKYFVYDTLLQQQPVTVNQLQICRTMVPHFGSLQKYADEAFSDEAIIADLVTPEMNDLAQLTGKIVGAPNRGLLLATDFDWKISLLKQTGLYSFKNQIIQAALRDKELSAYQKEYKSSGKKGNFWEAEGGEMHGAAYAINDKESVGCTWFIYGEEGVVEFSASFLWYMKEGKMICFYPANVSNIISAFKDDQTSIPYLITGAGPSGFSPVQLYKFSANQCTMLKEIKIADFDCYQ